MNTENIDCVVATILGLTTRFWLNQRCASVTGHSESRMEHNDEGIPLILVQSESEPSQFRRKPNPLPWPQLSVVLLVKTCDATATQSINPYINEVRATMLHGRASIRVDLPLYPACWRAGHYWWRRAQSRVLCWPDRKPLILIFGCSRAQQHL